MRQPTRGEMECGCCKSGFDTQKEKEDIYYGIKKRPLR